MIDITENDVRQPSGKFSLKRRRLRRDSFFQIKSTKIKGKYVHFAKIKKLYSSNFCVSPKWQLQESLLKCLPGKAWRKGKRRVGAAPGTPACHPWASATAKPHRPHQGTGGNPQNPGRLRDWVTRIKCCTDKYAQMFYSACLTTVLFLDSSICILKEFQVLDAF